MYIAILAVALLLLYGVLCTMLGFCCCCCFIGDGSRGGRRSPGAAGQTQGTTASSLLAENKDDEESLGSSYDSVSTDEEVGGDGEEEEEGRWLCVVCCDARRDCFFLPCGHSATCHPCGSRYDVLRMCFALGNNGVRGIEGGESVLAAVSQDCGGRRCQLPVLPEEAEESEEDLRRLTQDWPRLPRFSSVVRMTISGKR